MKVKDLIEMLQKEYKANFVGFLRNTRGNETYFAKFFENTKGKQSQFCEIPSKWKW